MNEDREGLRLHPVTDPDHLSVCVCVCACVSAHSWKTTSQLPRALTAEGFSRCNVRLIWPILSPRDSLCDLGPPASLSVCTEKTSNKDTSSRADKAVWGHAGVHRFAPAPQEERLIRHQLHTSAALSLLINSLEFGCLGARSLMNMHFMTVTQVKQV